MVAFDNLISKTNALADAGIDLANATEAEMQAFVNESVSAENAGVWEMDNCVSTSNNSVSNSF